LTAGVDNREAFFDALEKNPFEKIAEEYFPKMQSQKKITIMRKIWRKCKKAWRLLKEMQFSLRNVCHFVKWNYCTKQIRRVNKGYLLPLSDTIIQIDKDAMIVVDGCLRLGEQQVKGARQQTRIWLEEGAELKVDGTFTMYANDYVRVYKQSKLHLHNGFFNEHVQVMAGDIVEIGDECAVGRDVTLRSYDAHTILDDKFKICKPIKIGNHVWIGQGASILKGVHIEDGAIVGANAVVTKDVPAHSAVAGNPAKVVKENIIWE
jgi:acetyltransferase-like isoleucine patch superfamily enzyme